MSPAPEAATGGSAGVGAQTGWPPGTAEAKGAQGLQPPVAPVALGGQGAGQIPIWNAATQSWEAGPVSQALTMGAAAAQVVLAVSTPVVISATKDAFVTLQLNGKPNEVTTVASIFVGGVKVVTISFTKLTEELIQAVTVPVARGAALEVQVSAGALAGLNRSTTFAST